MCTLIFSLAIWQWNTNYTWDSQVNVRKFFLIFLIWNLFHLEDLLHCHRKLIIWSKPQNLLHLLCLLSHNGFSKSVCATFVSQYEKETIYWRIPFTLYYLWVLLALDIWIIISQFSLHFIYEFIVAG